ncbi:MAG TPA: hypothetical protein ACQGQI_07825 [Xylella sp.]
MAAGDGDVVPLDSNGMAAEDAAGHLDVFSALACGGGTTGEQAVAGVFAPFAGVLGAVDGGRLQVDVVTSRDQGAPASAAVDDLGAGQVGISSGSGDKGTAGVGHIESDDAVDAGPAEVAQAGGPSVADGGGLDIDITARFDVKVAIRLHDAANVVDVLAGGQGHNIATDLALEVVQIFGSQLNGAASGDDSVVIQVAFEGDVGDIGGDKGAAAIQVAALNAHIDLRHEGGDGGAIRQGDGLLHQPDNVAGELGHLSGAQGNAGTQTPGMGKGSASLQQGAVLGFVVSVAV